MITSAFISFFYYAITIPLSWIPDGGVFNPLIHNAVKQISKYLYVFNLILPVQELFNILAGTIVLMTVYISAKIVFWIIALIRGNSLSLIHDK